MRGTRRRTARQPGPARAPGQRLGHGEAARGDAMHTQGIEQGKAGYAAAIGVLPAIGVMVVSLVNRHLLERS